MLLVNNQKREKVTFEIFREQYGLKGDFVHDDSPDFLVTCDGSVLGIEITGIYCTDKINGKTLREHEVIKERIVYRACERAKEVGLPPLHVGVIFTGNIQNKRETYLTNFLFEIVKNIYPESGRHISLDFESGIPDDFWAILISNIPSSKKHVWNSTEAGCVETSFSEQIQQIIDSKAKKISQYLTKCEKCWLIIAALGVSGSNFYEIDEDMEKVCYNSPFEKVFFMEAFNKSLKELNLK
jgi:hypothetical protein